MELWQGASLALLAAVVAAGVAVLAYLAGRRARDAQASADAAGIDDVVAVLSVLPQAVVVLDSDDEVQQASTAAYALGLVRHDALAHADLRAMVEALHEDGEIHDAAVSLDRGPGGGHLRLDIRVAPLRGGRVLLLAEDRTEARRLEEMRRDFTANVSHELKTPVGALSLLAETITEAADEPDTVRHFARQMSTESSRLAALVQELIELSKLQRADALLAPELVDVDTVVAEALDRVRVEAMSRRITLVRGGTAGLRVYGDASLLTTAVRNLLDNAVRYSNPSGRVSVGVSCRDGEVRIAVVDQGAGIPTEQRDRVFERFYRGDEARSRETGGSGLGLSIVKHVAHDHGGRVELWSAPRTGSTFTLVLPEAHETDEPGEGARGQRAAAPRVPGPGSPRATVMTSGHDPAGLRSATSAAPAPMEDTHR